MIVGVLDIETTGWLKAGGHIVEVGMAKFDTVLGGVDVVLDIQCKEEGMKRKEQDAWIFKNSSLKVEEVRAAPILEELRPTIQAAFDGVDVLTAYNKSFDFTYMRDRKFNMGKEWPCPMLALTPYAKIDKKNGSKGYKWPTVEEAWNFLFPDFPYVEEHRGCDDAVHEASIIYAMFKKGWIK